METGGTNEAKLLRCWETNYKLPDQTQKATIQTPLNTQLLLSKFFQWKFAHLQQNSEQFDVTLFFWSASSLKTDECARDAPLPLLICRKYPDTTSQTRRLLLQTCEKIERHQHGTGSYAAIHPQHGLQRMNHIDWIQSPTPRGRTAICDTIAGRLEACRKLLSSQGDKALSDPFLSQHKISIHCDPSHITNLWVHLSLSSQFFLLIAFLGHPPGYRR